MNRAVFLESRPDHIEATLADAVHRIKRLEETRG